MLIGLLLVWVLHYLGQALHDRVVYRELTQANQAGVLGNVPAAADALVARLGSTWVLHLAICVVGLGLGGALFAAPAGWLVRAARRIGL